MGSARKYFKHITHRLDPTFLGSNLESKPFNPLGRSQFGLDGKPTKPLGGAQASQTDKTVLWAEPRRLRRTQPSYGRSPSGPDGQDRLMGGAQAGHAAKNALGECTQPFDRVLQEFFGRDFVRVFGFGFRLWLRLGILHSVRLLRRV
jgi:hypothetical protein